jgi:hypothetical protein
VANFLLFLDKCRIPPHWVLFDVHVNKFNGYQELFQFLVTATQVSVVEKPDKRTPLGWGQFKCEVMVGTNGLEPCMRQCCKNADWREHAVKTCSLKIRDAITIYPDFVDKSDKSKEIKHMLSGSQCTVSPSKGIFVLHANYNKSFCYSLIEHLLRPVECHHLELTCYEKSKFILSMTHSNGYECFANYCISVLEHMVIYPWSHL